jgi:predicted dehydrogenase
VSPSQGALLLGYGSIGRRHAHVLQEICASCAIIDTKEAARQQAARDCPGVRVAERLEDLDGDGFSWETSLAVIATWGPSHAEIFHKLVDRGVRRILCEKPLASSVADAAAMVHRARKEGVVLGVHHFIRYTGLAQALQAFALQHQLGEPVSVVVEGGAACLVTNGLHWIDFASSLFGAVPQRVVSTAQGQAINPRSPDLMLYGGTAIWSFETGQEAVISFSNRSSIALKTRIYYRDALVETDSDVGVVTIRRRDRAAVERFPAVTRTGPPVETLVEGMLPGVRTFDEGLRIALEEVSAGDASRSPATAGLDAVSACIGALIAARERRAIDLPIDVRSGPGQERWPIS